MSLKTFVAAAGFAAALTLPALAHHSHGNYNMTEFTTLKGTVKEIHWLTPHSWIYLEVKNEKGEAALWALEGASAGQLKQRGWSREMIKAGDTISVRCHVLMDKSTGCLLGYVTTATQTDKLFD